MTLGDHKQLTKLTVSLYRSYGGEYGVSTRKYEPIRYPRRAGETGIGPYLGTTQKDLAPIGGVFSGELNVTLRCTGAYPFTLRGLAPTLEVHN